MDFAWTAEQQRFRATVQDFLSSHLPADWETMAHGPASREQSAFAHFYLQH